MTNSIYSIRNNTNPNTNGLSFSTIKELFLEELRNFERVGFFVENLIDYCPYCGEGNGIQSGYDSKLKSLITKATYKPHLFPISEENILKNYQEDDLFDLIEFLISQVSLPCFKSEEGNTVPFFAKEYCNYGHYWHPDNFDKQEGCNLFKIKINEILNHYSLSKPYELNKNGTISIKAEAGLNKIIESPLKTSDELIKSKIDHSIKKYLGRHSNKADRIDAIKNLFDILEYLRPKIKKLSLSKDESDLFNIANGFSIRHNNKKQQNEYDPIWLSWMFYNSLSFIHVILHLLSKKEGK